MDFYEEYTRPDRLGGRLKHRARAGRQRRALERELQFGDFQCRHCRLHVSADRGRSGVQHRNHCPYCLWSKHVDLHASGDRLAACKQPMQPVGLTVKEVHKHYAPAQPGELMLVHQCTGCGALSINRLAADDSADRLWEVFEGSLALAPKLRAAATADGIHLLAEASHAMVRVRVFGHNALTMP